MKKKTFIHVPTPKIRKTTCKPGHVETHEKTYRRKPKHPKRSVEDVSVNTLWMTKKEYDANLRSEIAYAESLGITLD